MLANLTVYCSCPIKAVAMSLRSDVVVVSPSVMPLEDCLGCSHSLEGIALLYLWHCLHLPWCHEESAMFDSALDALNKGLDLGGVVREAQPFKHSKILHFTQVRWRSCDYHMLVTC